MIYSFLGGGVETRCRQVDGHGKTICDDQPKLNVTAKVGSGLGPKPIHNVVNTTATAPSAPDFMAPVTDALKGVGVPEELVMPLLLAAGVGIVLFIVL